MRLFLKIAFLKTIKISFPISIAFLPTNVDCSMFWNKKYRQVARQTDQNINFCHVQRKEESDEVDEREEFRREWIYCQANYYLMIGASNSSKKASNSVLSLSLKVFGLFWTQRFFVFLFGPFSFFLVTLHPILNFFCFEMYLISCPKSNLITNYNSILICPNSNISTYIQNLLSSFQPFVALF